MTKFDIVPIPGREKIQQNFATLPSKAANYSERRLTLNERFSIIERGYYLKPQEAKIEKSPYAGKTKLIFFKDVNPVELQRLVQDKIERKKRNENKSQSSQFSLADIERPPSSIDEDSAQSTSESP